MKSSTKCWVRKAHRWLGISIGIQLLFWTASGFYFSLIPINTIHGAHLTHELNHPLKNLPDEMISPVEALMKAKASGAETKDISKISLRQSQHGPWYRIVIPETTSDRLVRIDAQNGQIFPKLNRASAINRAKDVFIPEVDVREISYVTEVPVDSEYRGKPLPVWRVHMDHDSGSVLYISPDTGELIARRTDAWRIFDFLWMLHILDFEARDNFNHWLLRIMAGMGLVTVLSGFLLWSVSTSLFRKK